MTEQKLTGYPSIQIDKILYRNNKQEFKLLEKMGAEYVSSLE